MSLDSIDPIEKDKFRSMRERRPENEEILLVPIPEEEEEEKENNIQSNNEDENGRFAPSLSKKITDRFGLRNNFNWCEVVYVTVCFCVFTMSLMTIMDITACKPVRAYHSLNVMINTARQDQKLVNSYYDGIIHNLEFLRNETIALVKP